MAIHKYDWSNIPKDLWGLFSYDLDFSTKQKFMKEAIKEAKKSYKPHDDGAQCGAVIVQNNEIISQGHREVICPTKEGKTRIIHAEQMALYNAGKNAKGSDLYVTLEPCFKRGNLELHEEYPPCSTLIPNAGVERAIIGLIDKNQNTNGKGIKHLVELGVKVEFIYNDIEKDLFNIVREGKFYSMYPTILDRAR